MQEDFLNNMEEIVEIKELQEDFIGRGEVKGFHFKQLKKTDKAFLYHVTMPECSKSHYEIFKRVVHIRFGCVAYPKSTSFGINAFSRKTLEEAEVIFEQLNRDNTEEVGTDS